MTIMFCYVHILDTMKMACICFALFHYVPLCLKKGLLANNVLFQLLSTRHFTKNENNHKLLNIECVHL
jgi:hypothetical protein